MSRPRLIVERVFVFVETVRTRHEAAADRSVFFPLSPAEILDKSGVIHYAFG